MNDFPPTNITVAPTLADTKTLVIYRENGEEVAVKITDKGTLASEKKLSLEEVDFIKENYL